MRVQQLPYFEFRDFPAGLEDEVKEALLTTLHRKQYILGQAVTSFEKKFALYLGADAAIGVGNGFDALVIALKSLGIGAGDEVVLPVNTFIATLNAALQVGAKPVLVEPDIDTYNMTAEEAAKVVNSKTKVILPVHLYGQPCDMNTLQSLAEAHHLKIVEDAAQAHGATYKQKKAGTFGQVSAFSFYPTKNLGAFGDAGAVVTSDASIAAYVRQYHNYGEAGKYNSVSVGVNSRLDELQAAVLQVKLQHLEKLTTERQRLAQNYVANLESVGDIVLPYTIPGATHVYHIFNIRTQHREALREWLLLHNINTAIHYPVPLHLQPAYRYLGYKPGSFPVAEMLAQTSLSLPLFPGMQEQEQLKVIEAVKSFFKYN